MSRRGGWLALLAAAGLATGCDDDGASARHPDSQGASDLDVSTADSDWDASTTDSDWDVSAPDGDRDSRDDVDRVPGDTQPEPGYVCVDWLEGAECCDGVVAYWDGGGTCGWGYPEAGPHKEYYDCALGCIEEHCGGSTSLDRPPHIEDLCVESLFADGGEHCTSDADCAPDGVDPPPGVTALQCSPLGRCVPPACVAPGACADLACSDIATIGADDTVVTIIGSERDPDRVWVQAVLGDTLVIFADDLLLGVETSGPTANLDTPIWTVPSSMLDHVVGIADMDSDGSSEVVLISPSEQHVWIVPGDSAGELSLDALPGFDTSGWPVLINASTRSAIANVLGDSTTVTTFVDGEVHTVDVRPSAAELGLTAASPFIADLDGDGVRDVWFWADEGTRAAIASGEALADGRLEIVTELMGPPDLSERVYLPLTIGGAHGRPMIRAPYVNADCEAPAIWIVSADDGDHIDVDALPTSRPPDIVRATERPTSELVWVADFDGDGTSDWMFPDDGAASVFRGSDFEAGRALSDWEAAWRFVDPYEAAASPVEGTADDGRAYFVTYPRYTGPDDIRATLYRLR